MEDLAVFVTSFSEKPDLLSQWRGYCPGGAGVCVGFAKDEIEAFCNRKGYKLTKCIYDHDTLRKLIALIVKECEEKLPTPAITRKEYNQLSSYEAAKFATEAHARLKNGGYSVKKALREACDAITKLAPLFKNQGFREEAEWRIVATEPLAPISFRPSTSYFCPYIQAGILEQKSTLREVIVGPNPNLKRASISVQMLLSANGYDNAKVKASSLPFNNW